jgi:hypothetical protein
MLSGTVKCITRARTDCGEIVCALAVRKSSEW